MAAQGPLGINQRSNMKGKEEEKRKRRRKQIKSFKVEEINNQKLYVWCLKMGWHRAANRTFSCSEI